MEECIMAFCVNCGAKLIDGAKFCGNCGTAAASASPQPAHQASAGGKTAEQWNAEGDVFFDDEKNYAEAIRCYTEAIKLDPAGAEYYCDRGAAYGREKEYEKALIDFTKAIELEEDTSSYLWRGFVYDKMKEYPKAVADLTKSLELDKNNAEAKKLLEESRENLKNMPTTGDGWKAKGVEFQQLKKFKDAIYCYNKAIALKNDDGTYYSNRATCWKFLDDYEKSMADYNKAIALGETFARYWGRGEVFENIRDKSNALADYKKALALDPNHEKASITRSRIIWLEDGG
jgi:tetratricopeptide (TPR) repeat protein